MIFGQQGIAAGAVGDHERAIVLLRRATQLEPGNATLFACLARSCMLTFRIDEAVAAGEKSVQIDPANAGWLISLAVIAEYADGRDRSVDLLRRLLALYPDHADARMMLGNLRRSSLRATHRLSVSYTPASHRVSSMT